MKLASIIPVQSKHLMYLGNYEMLLAHLANEYPACTNKNCYKIMDNSLIELGGAVSIEQVINAANRCNADEIILPDVYKDGPATLISVCKNIEWLRDHNLLGRFRLMAVCQGKDVDEFIETFHQLKNIPEIHCIGIPKVCSTLWSAGRPGFEFLWLNNCTKNIHLLGVWSTMQELLEYKNPQLIRSVDTCIPALLSMYTDYAWYHRPSETIDLKTDVVNSDHYFTILKTLSQEGIEL